MFASGDPSSIDLLQLLKEREKDPAKVKALNTRYSDIILIFDFDPHDSLFTSAKIIEMMRYFTESSDMGKLYLNYPTVEAFYHMRSIPDEEYYGYIVLLEELSQGAYKQRVNRENRNHDYSKFAVTRNECNAIIQQNIDKSWRICGSDNTWERDDSAANCTDILEHQLSKMESENAISVLCTCAFYIVDYNSNLIST